MRITSMHADTASCQHIANKTAAPCVNTALHICYLDIYDCI